MLVSCWHRFSSFSLVQELVCLSCWCLGAYRLSVLLLHWWPVLDCCRRHCRWFRFQRCVPLQWRTALPAIVSLGSLEPWSAGQHEVRQDHNPVDTHILLLTWPRHPVPDCAFWKAFPDSSPVQAYSRAHASELDRWPDCSHEFLQGSNWRGHSSQPCCLLVPVPCRHSSSFLCPCYAFLPRFRSSLRLWARESASAVSGAIVDTWSRVPDQWSIADDHSQMQWRLCRVPKVACVPGSLSKGSFLVRKKLG